jgi:hypothetical protein
MKDTITKTEKLQADEITEYRLLLQIAFRARTFLNYDKETTCLKELAPEFKADLQKSIDKFTEMMKPLGI